jgi:hypothetical protein
VFFFPRQVRQVLMTIAMKISMLLAISMDTVAGIQKLDSIFNVTGGKLCCLIISELLNLLDSSER